MKLQDMQKPNVVYMHPDMWAYLWASWGQPPEDTTKNYAREYKGMKVILSKDCPEQNIYFMREPEK